MKKNQNNKKNITKRKKLDFEYLLSYDMPYLHSTKKIGNVMEKKNRIRFVGDVFHVQYIRPNVEAELMKQVSQSTYSFSEKILDELMSTIKNFRPTVHKHLKQTLKSHELENRQSLARRTREKLKLFEKYQDKMKFTFALWKLDKCVLEVNQ